MKREIFTFGKKDYETYNLVEFIFNVAESNIESFLKILHATEKTISESKIGIISNKERKYKTIKVKTYPQMLYFTLLELGMSDRSEVRVYTDVYQYKFDNSRKKNTEKYAIYSKNRGFRLSETTPVVVVGNQVRFRDMLLRRYSN